MKKEKKEKLVPGSSTALRPQVRSGMPLNQLAEDPKKKEKGGTCCS